VTRAAARRTADWTPGRAAPRCLLNHRLLNHRLFHHEGLQPRARKNQRKPSAADGHRLGGQLGRAGTAWPSQVMGADPGMAGRPATQADPAAVTGARTAPPPIRTRSQVGPRPDTRRLPRGGRATRRPPQGRAIRQLPRAPATHRRPPAPATRRLQPARETPRQPPAPATRRLQPARETPRQPPALGIRHQPGGPGPGAPPGGGDGNRLRAASQAVASPHRLRPRPTAVRRHERTRGGARNGAPARRSRARRGTVLPAEDLSLAGRCGAQAPSGPRAPADAARCADSRQHPERPTRCTRRASSRRGTHLRSARSVRPRGPD
jgi:hypothetical protein